MKKLLLILFVIGLSAGIIHAANLKNEDVVGNWKYTVETYDGYLTGIIKITENDNKLEGEVNDDMGSIFELTKIVIENDELIFELQPDFEVIKVKAKLEDKKLVGAVIMQDTEFKFTAEKK